MSKLKIPVTDVEKLTAESLQLRNQQFFIATLALSGAGLAFWFLNSITIDIKNPTPDIIKILMFYIAWLITLLFLYRWSLNLHLLITIISEFQKHTEVDPECLAPSTWEDWYYQLPRNEEDLNNYKKEIQKHANIQDDKKDALKNMTFSRKATDLPSKDKSTRGFFEGLRQVFTVKPSILSQTTLGRRSSFRPAHFSGLQLSA